MPKEPSAPGSLELVREFINSVDLEKREMDRLRDPGSALAYLSEIGIDAGSLEEGDLPPLREIREELRSELLSHGRHEMTPKSRPQIPDYLSGELLVVRGEDGSLELVPAARRGYQRVRAALFAAVYEAQVRGTWPRLKACRKHSCLYAFYDKSKNGSGAWCNMDTCGNRVKAERRRARERNPASD
jgi:predicted RNA-binding Zn ribbon-like protein